MHGQPWPMADHTARIAHFALEAVRGAGRWDAGMCWEDDRMK